MTAGCRLNQAESDILRGRLREAGWNLAEQPEKADVCFINTCTVTAAADRSSMQLVRRACRAEPKPRVVVLGCLAQRSPERLRSVAGVDEIWDGRRKRNELSGYHPWPGRSRALLKVQDGCDRECAYCVVAGLRGRPVSVRTADVLAGLERLLAEGFCEVVLTGLNLGLYQDENGIGLSGLVEEVCGHLDRQGSVARIRLGSLEPDTVTEDLARTLGNPRVVPHFHLALQSGDDVVLALSGRRYDQEGFRRVVTALRRVRPDANIGLDVIAGLPAEDEESFSCTVKLLEELAPGYLHTFVFSARPGTPAAVMDGAASSRVSRERARILRRMGVEFKRRYQGRFVGTVREAVVESSATGLTDNYLRLMLEKPAGTRRSLVQLLVCEEQGRLVGRPVEELASCKEVA